jgi:hypothetical protein
MRGDGYVYRRGERWWAGYYRDGTFCREPAKLADSEGVLRPAKNEREAQRFLRARIKAVLGGRFLGPQEERITVGEILDAVEQSAESKKLRSLRKTRCYAKAVRKTFAFTRAVDVSTGDIEQYIKERKDAGRAEATINRELEILRRAYRLAVKGKLLSAARAPDVELLRLDNIRQGFFERAEIEALLQRISPIVISTTSSSGASAPSSGKARSPSSPGTCSIARAAFGFSGFPERSRRTRPGARLGSQGRPGRSWSAGSRGAGSTVRSSSTARARQSGTVDQRSPVRVAERPRGGAASRRPTLP